MSPPGNGREAPLSRRRSRNTPSSLTTITQTKIFATSLTICAILSRHLGTTKATKIYLAILHKLCNVRTTWARENPLPTAWSGATPSPRPAEEPRAIHNVSQAILRKWRYHTQINHNRKILHVQLYKKQKEYYTLSSTKIIYEHKTSPRLIRSLGEGMEGASFDGVTMAQSPGDGSSRGLCSLQVFYKFTINNYTRNPFPRETIKARALTSWGFVTCCGLRVFRALRNLGRWWFLWATAGARPCATFTPRTSSRRFFSTLPCSLAPAKRPMCSRVPTFIAPLRHVIPSMWRLPHWLPRGWRQPRRDLARAT